MRKTEKPNNSEPKITLESDRKQHIGILEELKAKIEKENWTNFINVVKCKYTNINITARVFLSLAYFLYNSRVKILLRDLHITARLKYHYGFLGRRDRDERKRITSGYGWRYFTVCSY